MPIETALPSVYDPMKEVESLASLAVDAINMGRLAMKQQVNENELQQAVLDFVKKYALRHTHHIGFY